MNLPFRVSLRTAFVAALGLATLGAAVPEANAADFFFFSGPRHYPPPPPRREVVVVERRPGYSYPPPRGDYYYTPARGVFYLTPRNYDPVIVSDLQGHPVHRSQLKSCDKGHSHQRHWWLSKRDGRWVFCRGNNGKG